MSECRGDVVSLERAVGAELSVHDSQEEAAAQLVGDRRAEAHRHARRTHVLTSGLHSATNDFATYVRQVRGRGALRAPRAGTLLDTLDSGTVGHLLAAGIDERLLAIPLEASMDVSQAELTRALKEAGPAAEDFGSALSRWASEDEFKSTSA